MTDQTPPLPAGFSVVPAGNQPPPPPAGFAIQNAPDNPFTRWFNSDRNTPSQINDVSTKLPKLGAQAIASMPTDQKTKMQYLARQIFPDMDPETALGRMGVDSGRVFYIGNDEKAYYAEPGDFSPISEPGRTAAQLPDMVAANVGPAMSTVGGMSGGLATVGVAGGVPGAALGGAAGDLLRQKIAKSATGEDMPMVDRLIHAAGEGAAQGVGQLTGIGLAKGAGTVFNRNPLRIAGYDAGGMTSRRIDDMQAAADKAYDMGVTVTPGEAGNVSSLLQRQRQIGRQGEGADVLSDFYTKRNTEQLPAGWEMTMDVISPVKAPAVGARNLQSGADAAIGKAFETQSSLAGPKYRAVVTATNIIDPMRLAPLMDDDIIKIAAKSIRSDKVLNADLKTAPDNSLLFMDAVKKRIDAMYNKASMAGDKNRARILDNARVKLRDGLDAAVPDYKPARDAFAGQVPEIEALTEGLTGLVAKDRASGLQNVPKTMFDIGSADSLSITTARNAFEKAGKLNDWNAGLRSYLDNIFQAASKQDQGPAATVWKNLKADKRQYANLKAATTPDQLRALDDFFQVAEMVKRAPKEGSPTATDLNKRPEFAGPAARFFGNVAKGVNPLNWADAIGDKIFDVSAGKNVGNLAKLITSPDAIQSLRRLKVLKPGTQKFITEAGYLGEALGMSALGGYLGGQQPNQLPAMFGGQ